MPGRGPAWTDEEQRIFQTAYPHVGSKGVHELIPHRTPGAIDQRALLHKIRMLPRPERLSLDAVRAQLFPAQPAERKRSTYVGISGQSWEYGTTAGTKEGLEKVPDAATNLPWVTYPRDPATARAVAAACEFLAASSDAVKKVGPEAQRFFESQARYLRAIADRMEQKASA